MPGLHADVLSKVLQKAKARFNGAVRAVLSSAEDLFERAAWAVQDWYEEKLDRRGRDRVDQTLHVVGWFLLAAVGSAALAWAVAHHREFVRQAPIERIDDTERDMRFMLIGSAAGQVVHSAWTTCLAVAVFRTA